MKKTLSIILAILMIVTMLPMTVLPASAADTPVPYDGVAVEPMKISEENYKILGLTANNWSQFKGYYAIRDAKELYGFAALVNKVIETKNYNAVLLQDIVVNTNGSNKYDWEPINSAGGYVDYDGIFDGNGHYISGLYSTITENYQGKLIGGFIANLQGTVKNLTIKDSTFAPSELFAIHDGLGTITGFPFGCVIKNCRVENVNLTVRNNEGQIGGIAGFGNGYGSSSGDPSTIKNCVSIGVTISGATYSDPIAPKAPYSKCYTSADAEHTCADISVQHKTVLATCEYPGRSNYKYCLVCGEVTTGTKTETAAKGHNWNAATCTDPKTCKTCGEIEGTALPHTWTEIEADNGYEHSRKCTVCGATDSKGNHSWVNKKCEICNYECTHEADDKWLTDQTTHHKSCIYNCGAWLNYNYHKFSDGVCTECNYECVHSYDSQTYKCTYCKLPCSHNLVEVFRFDATCSAQGLVKYECTDCGYEEDEILDTSGHLFTYTYNDAYHIGECEYCDYILHQSHKMAYTYTDPTCEDYGYQIHACEVCSYGNTTTYAEPLYHTGGEPTCTSPAICERCGESYGETAAHTGGEATCTERAICEVCEQSYGQLKDHDPDMDDGDCTTDITCEVCGVTVEEGNKNHTWDENNFCSNPNCYQTKGFTFTFTYGEEKLFTRNVHTGGFYTFETLEERDGLSFLGWDADEDGVVDYAAFDYIYISEDRAFNAVYGLMYTVHYITYDIWKECYGEYFYPSTGEPGQIVTLHSDYSPYYNFLGWAMEEGGEVVYEPNEEIALTENLTLYGVIRPYRATFELGEGAVWNDENGNPITCLEGDYSGSWIEIYDFPTRTGYIFKGFVDQVGWTWEPWQDEESGEWIVDFYFDARDLVMTALWEECTDHSFTDCVCDICGYECIHANTENDVCTDCGKDVHVCDFERIEWTTDETAHWKTCSCGDEELYGEHTVSDGLCEICGYEFEKPEEPTPEEPTPDEPTPDEPTPEEPTPDEPTPDEPTPDEPTPDEPTLDEPTPDEPTPEEPTPDEPTPDEPTEDTICEDCGKVHDGFFAEFICFFTKIINFIKNLFA